VRASQQLTSVQAFTEGRHGRADGGITARYRPPVTGEARQREAICRLARSLYERRYTHGSTGNISLRLEDGWLLTPTGSSLGDLDPERLSRLDRAGRLLSGDQPTKETFLHLAMYEQRPHLGAVVHLHSTQSVAVSVMEDVDPSDVLPPLTAYYVMRVGRLPLVPYYPPGDLELAEAVRARAREHHAMLLANHGPVVGGPNLESAGDAIEELEETARLFLTLRGTAVRPLTPEQVALLREKYRIEP
jgi:ribulose-5-phosphate 4-epimerase/fuculose-1-phosphate aldolase